MKMLHRTLALLVLASALLYTTATPAQAQEYDIPETIHPKNAGALDFAAGKGARMLTGGAIISNGTVQLGVHDQGHLNVGGGPPSSGTGTPVVGLRYVPTGAESTAPGCLCEGWGVKDANTGVWGGADEAALSGGFFNLDVVSFVATATTATSIVEVDDASDDPVFRVTHAYRPSPTPNLYEVNVTIQNVSSSTTDVRYRRVMDWDVEPTAFAENVTIQGTAAAANVVFASDDGFAGPNPVSGTPSLLFTGDAVDSGPADHGALFDFTFGELAPGASVTFNTYYGAAGTEQDALNAIGAVGAEVYSLGQTSTGAETGEPNTFIFAFRGVGGTAPPPPCDPSDINESVDFDTRTITLDITDAEGVREVNFVDDLGTAVLENFVATNTAGGLTSADGIHWSATAPFPTTVQFELQAPTAASSRYMVEVINECFVETTIDPIYDFTGEVANSFKLIGASPNPFNPTTNITFEIPEATVVNLVVYDIMGREVQRLISQPMEAGRHTVAWNGRDGSGLQVASGTYLYHIQAGSHSATKSMVLLK